MNSILCKRKRKTQRRRKKLIQSEKLLSLLLSMHRHLNGFLTLRIFAISKSFVINFGIFIKGKIKQYMSALVGPYIGKYFALGLRPRTVLKTSAKLFSIRTSLRQITYMSLSVMKQVREEAARRQKEEIRRCSTIRLLRFVDLTLNLNSKFLSIFHKAIVRFLPCYINACTLGAT